MASQPPGGRSPAPSFEPVARVVRRVQRRIRVQRALDAASVGGVLGLALATLLLAGHKTATLAIPLAWLAACVLGPALLFATAAALRRVSPLLAARLADRSHALSDLLSSAWAFGQRQDATPFMRACVERALGAAPRVEPARAVTLHTPKGTSGLAVGALALALVAALEVPAREAVAIPRPPAPRLLAQDDVDAFREGLASLAIDSSHDAELARRADDLNKLLEAAADGALDRAAALEALAELSDALEHGQDPDVEALREALAELGAALEGAELSEHTAEALAEGEAQRAAEALEQAARELPEADAAKLRALEKRLERAKAPPKDRSEERVERAERELDRLLKKKPPEQADGAEAQQQKRLLEKKKRELDQLRREHEQAQRLRRELEQLRRDLGDAASSLGGGNQSDASRQLSKGAEELSRMGKQQRAGEQREAMKRQIAQLRELLRRQGDPKGGDEPQKQQRLSTARFGQLARGGHEGGEQGGARKSESEGKKAGMLMPGGQGNGEEGLLLEGDGTEPTDSTVAVMQGGEGAGSGGRPEEGAATDLEGRTVDVRVTGQKGEGPSRAEVIREASTRGFASESYRKVHTEYERHAEEVLERDQVPGGYRFYVRRYFQLIRPREATR